ncbi:MAG: putative porin, partial [Paramuribaculum sp.]|nr:putative porin [Paramuribaculum sp.]
MKKNLYIRYIILIFAVATIATAMGKSPRLAPSYAWTTLPPLGLHQEATIDTLLYNYYQKSVPSEVSPAYATTGNLGAEGMNMIFFEREPMSDFFFRDGLQAWLPPLGTHKYYNTRIPMTMLSYNASGGKQDSQDRLKATFSGNAGPKFQFGADLDYLYSKGSYENQAVKDLMWGLSTSYMGDRYELQAFFNHYNNLNKENGGITDDLYIIDPAVLQGGSASITPKSIPTRLSGAHTRLKGQEFYMNHRYKLGYWHVTPPNDTIPEDTVEHRTYIPVSSFIWTMDYNSSSHVFDNSNSEEASDFWTDFYFDTDRTHDRTSYWSLKNTFGVSLLEGFNKYAKAGLSAYLTHEVRRYNFEVDPTLVENRLEHLSILPDNMPAIGGKTENLLWVGAQLTKQRGKLFRYEATGN